MVRNDASARRRDVFEDAFGDECLIMLAGAAAGGRP